MRKGKSDYDLDSAMEDINAREERNSRASMPVGGSVATNSRSEIGVVEKYFEKIGVVAIALTAELRTGDLIEIGSDEEHVRQRVTSMQINRVDVESASAGDSVGIKMKYHVDEGASVYKLQ